MTWETRIGQAGDASYLAIGINGAFLAYKSGRYYYAKYISADKRFNFPRRRTLEEIKSLCEENDYWEA